MAEQEPHPTENSLKWGRETHRIVRYVMLSQFLFMAGNSLTVGGFFNYFVYAFHPSAFLFAVALIIPETAQSLSVVARRVISFRNRRKRNWITFLIGGRLFAMLLPLALLWPEDAKQNIAPLLWIFGCTAGWYLLQGISYVNYISWLSDLVPEEQWGRLFSRRQLAGLTISLGFPFLVAWMRKYVLAGLPQEAERWSYCLLFIGGGLLTLASILPLWNVADRCDRDVPSPAGGFRWHHLQLTRSFCFLLASRWWLAFFQGLTQAVLFQYAAKTLHLSLPAYTNCICLMVLLQMPMAYWGGYLSDRFQDKRAMFGSMLLVSLALPFWIFATAESWYLICIGYALWGGFGMLNVSGQNLCLKLAPPSDNAAHVALYEQVAGLIAGLAGLLGGFLLDRLLEHPVKFGGSSWSPFVILFTVSWLGRMTAPLWLYGVNQPHHEHRR